MSKQGRSGGLVLYWSSSFNCSISNYSFNHIDAEIVENDKGTWRLTGYYGFPNNGRRREAWNFLRQLANVSNLPWCILGDFNDILSPHEKKGNNARANWLINGLRNVVCDFGLADIHTEGYLYTWFKSLGTTRAVEERLDRALATDNWQVLFPNAVLDNLPAPSSDHYAIMLSCAPQPNNRRLAPRFKFENAWLADPGFSIFIKDKWNSYGACPIVEKLEFCASDLTDWSKNNFHLKREIDICRNNIGRMRSQVDSDNIHQFNDLRSHMTQLLIQEDAFWCQRVKTHWLRDGDLNTKFFHVTASSRRIINRIHSLMDSDNNRVTDDNKLCDVARNYIVDLFQEQNSDIDPLIEAINASISIEDNNRLLAPFLIEEFKEALFSMKPDKCPGPDGFNPGFFQKFWASCGEELFHQCCEWLDTCSFPSTLNSTTIALIPKGESQTSMKDWRPIALCNVIYKVVAKVLANCLKLVLNKCISDSQSAFVPGRSILDNAMAPIEIIHYMKSKVKGKVGDVALKHDISKAYDRIDWSYLKRVMMKIGFSDIWINWISMCIEIVDYSVLVNGSVAGPIILGRGLRQGDPLSPYLFIICAKGLSAFIRKAEARGNINGVKICTKVPIVSHLLFVDDCFLFFRGNINQAEKMKNILAFYEKASGQAINLQKSEIFCSRNVSTAEHNNIANILGVQVVLGIGKHLGLPSMIGRSKKATFNFIKDRVWKKINSWSSKCLSKAGREVLIKSVLQSIPTYFMSLLTLLSSLCDDIEKTMNSFWWGHSGAQSKGIHWMSWDKLSMHKKDGGMGFKSLGTFNLVMLGKQGWRILTNPHTLIARMFKARYFPNSNFFKATLGHKLSYVWRSICNAKFILKAGRRWKIGDGSLIPIWNNNWIAGNGYLTLQNQGPTPIDNLKVSDCILPEEKAWNVPFLLSIFDEHIVNQVVNTPLYPSVHDDRLVWTKENNGEYSVHSAYRMCMQELFDVDHFKAQGSWDLIWKLKIPLKVKNLI